MAPVLRMQPVHPHWANALELVVGWLANWAQKGKDS